MKCFSFTPYFLVLICLFFLISCEETKCEKATADYNKILTTVNTAQGIYNTAVAAMESICGLADKNTKSLDLSDACKKAKAVVEIADKSLLVVNALLVNYKLVLDSACPK